MRSDVVCNNFPLQRAEILIFISSEQFPFQMLLGEISVTKALAGSLMKALAVFHTAEPQAMPSRIHTGKTQGSKPLVDVTHLPDPGEDSGVFGAHCAPVSSQHPVGQENTDSSQERL